jgi:hypothetical protein
MSITADILNDPCISLDNFTINGAPGSTVSIDNGIKLLTLGNEEIGGDAYILSDLSSSPNQITIEVIINFTKLGSYFEGTSFDYIGLGTTTRAYEILFTTNGLYILYEESFVRIPDVILYNETAADQIWRFEIDKTIETNATVEVFINNVSLGSYNIGFASENDNNLFVFAISENTNQIAEAHVKSIKIGTGLGSFTTGPDDGTGYGITGTIPNIQYTPSIGVIEPVAGLSWSVNKGKTWSNEYLCPLGKPGRFSTKAVWRALGWSYNRVWKLTVDSPIKKVVLGAYAEISK